MPRVFQSNGPAAAHTLDVRPDDTDSRDYIFEPSLKLLDEVLDPRRRVRLTILDQGREGSCVGHALAAVINLSLWLRHRQAPAGRPVVGSELVSELMLYDMGRRYDEWKGEHYEGTSLRGGMKGWHKHGVCSRRAWAERTKPKPKLDWREDALTRPMGTYYRILDSDVSHVQAAVAEGDAVLASAWVHSGWEAASLQPPSRTDRLGVKRIPVRRNLKGLHAFAIIGYGPEGFLVQNSWGRRWGSGGLAVLSYEDWFDNRQDAWVARPGPPTLDEEGQPRVFLVGFAGTKPSPAAALTGTSGAEGLDVDPAMLPFVINTGDRGELSRGGRIETHEEDLPSMAAQIHFAQPHNGVRNVLLYAHGGLVSETGGLEHAAALWKLCRERNLTAYFFVWETGFKESFLGSIRSGDDALGPRTGWGFGDLWRGIKGAAKKSLRKSQELGGAALAGLGRDQWSEMHGRAAGAAKAEGGARRFADQLIRAMEQAAAVPGSAPFRLHLVGHSAGSIYLGRLFEGYLRNRLAAANGVQLASMQFLAPAISMPLAKQAFLSGGALPVPRNRFRVFTLTEHAEDNDSIIIYPSSLLTYVADHLEKDGQRVPLLGLATDLKNNKNPLTTTSVTHLWATKSKHHGELDNPGQEVDAALDFIQPAP